MLYFFFHPIQLFSPFFKILANKIDLDGVYLSEVGIKGAKDMGFGQLIKWDFPFLDGCSFYFINNWFMGKQVIIDFGMYLILELLNCYCNPITKLLLLLMVDHIAQIVWILSLAVYCVK